MNTVREALVRVMPPDTEDTTLGTSYALIEVVA